MEHAFISWSGGKDSCLAYYRAIRNGIKARYLLNMVREDGSRSRSHGLATEWLQMQAQAIGIPLVQRQTSWADYEAEFKKALLAFKDEGIATGVFGDIDLDGHRQWVERVCSECGITARLPLWQESQDRLLREFIQVGFEAVVVAIKADLLGEEWLERRITPEFLADLAEAKKDITPCGEAGEYHTFVINGPLFEKRIRIVEAERVLRDDHWFLDIKKCELAPR